MRCPSTALPAAPVAILVLAHLTSLSAHYNPISVAFSLPWHGQHSWPFVHFSPQCLPCWQLAWWDWPRHQSSHWHGPSSKPAAQNKGWQVRGASTNARAHQCVCFFSFIHLFIQNLPLHPSLFPHRQLATTTNGPEPSCSWSQICAPHFHMYPLLSHTRLHHGVRLVKMFKKNNVTLDMVAFGDSIEQAGEGWHSILHASVENASSSDSLYVTLPSLSFLFHPCMSWYNHTPISYDITFTPSTCTVVNHTVHSPLPAVTIAQLATELLSSASFCLCPALAEAARLLLLGWLAPQRCFSSARMARNATVRRYCKWVVVCSGGFCESGGKGDVMIVECILECV